MRWSEVLFAPVYRLTVDIGTEQSSRRELPEIRDDAAAAAAEIQNVASITQDLSLFEYVENVRGDLLSY
jgi:hypothetical protein